MCTTIGFGTCVGCVTTFFGHKIAALCLIPKWLNGQLSYGHGKAISSGPMKKFDTPLLWKVAHQFTT